MPRQDTSERLHGCRRVKKTDHVSYWLGWRGSSLRSVRIAQVTQAGRAAEHGRTAAIIGKGCVGAGGAAGDRVRNR